MWRLKEFPLLSRPLPPFGGSRGCRRNTNISTNISEILGVGAGERDPHLPWLLPLGVLLKPPHMMNTTGSPLPQASCTPFAPPCHSITPISGPPNPPGVLRLPNYPNAPFLWPCTPKSSWGPYIP